MEKQERPSSEAQTGASSAGLRGDADSKKSPLVITDLLRTSRQLSDALAPLPPRTTFRSDLHDDLVLTARRLYAQRILTGEASNSWDDALGRGGPGLIGGYLPSRRAVWSAAAVGLGSAVSVISVMAAYYWRRRGRREDDDPGATTDEVRRAA